MTDDFPKPELLRLARLTTDPATGREFRSFCASSKWGDGEARYSENNRALLIPRLYAEPDLVRAVAAGGTLVNLLRLVEAFRTPPDGDPFTIWTWSYVWGDFEMFEGGAPVIRNTVLMRGNVMFPDLNEVMPFVRELTKRS